jgi:hypothetical protein
VTAHALRTTAAGAVTGAAAAGAALVLLAPGGGGAAPDGPVDRPRPLPPLVSPAGLIERTGVRIVRVTASGGGGLLDVRYQVVNPAAAAGAHDAQTPPALVDERTGGVIARLLMGHLPHARPKAGVTYYLVFGNPGNAVRRGDRVSVVLGDARLAHVRVS